MSRSTMYLKSVRKQSQRLLDRWCERPELFFLSFMIPFGLICVFVMPPFMVPDENAHLYRAYQISEGHLTSVTQNGITGSIIPLDLKRDVDSLYSGVINGGATAHVDYGHFLKKKINTNDRGFIQFDTTSVYSPASYIPQAIGISLARLIYPSELVILYTGRLFNLVAFIALVYAAIRITPIRKWVFVVVALFPMTIQQASSLSSDVTNIGIVFVAIALVLRLATLRSMNNKLMFLSFAVAFVLGLTKQTNVLLVLPFLFLPTRLFGSLKRRFWFSAGMVVIAFGSALAWYMLTKYLHYNFDYSSNPTVDMTAQIHFFISHPLHDMKVLFNTFIFNTSSSPPQPDFYLSSIVGVFSWIRYQLPLLGILLAYGLMFMTLLLQERATKDEEAITKHPLFRWSLPVTFILSVLAIAFTLYLMWTPVGALSVSGIQGRYFIALLPLLIPIFITNKATLVFKNKHFPIILSTKKRGTKKGA